MTKTRKTVKAKKVGVRVSPKVDEDGFRESVIITGRNGQLIYAGPTTAEEYSAARRTMRKDRMYNGLIVESTHLEEGGYMTLYRTDYQGDVQSGKAPVREITFEEAKHLTVLLVDVLLK